MLTGTLKSGAKIEAIPSCQCEASPANSPTNWDCGETAVYRVVFKDGGVLHACEEHVEKLWDRDEVTGGGTTAGCATKAEKDSSSSSSVLPAASPEGRGAPTEAALKIQILMLFSGCYGTGYNDGFERESLSVLMQKRKPLFDKLAANALALFSTDESRVAGRAAAPQDAELRAILDKIDAGSK